MSRVGTLLIAGPSCIEDLPERPGTIGGAGAYAAIAAAAMVPTQLWSRGGSGFDERLLQLMRDRRIDMAGFGTEGASDGQSPALPETEPVGEADVQALLMIDLPADCLQRVKRVRAAVRGLDTALLVWAPRLEDYADADSLLAAMDGVDCCIAPLAAMQQRLQLDDPVRTGQAIRDAGAKAVALTAGALGGLLWYKQKRSTWPSLVLDGTEAHPAGHAIFAGVLASHLAHSGHLDYRGLKRGVNVAGATAGLAAQGVGPVKLLGMDSAAYHEAFLRQRRNAKA